MNRSSVHMSNRAQSNPQTLLPEAVAARLADRGATDRWQHVRSVVHTVERMGADGGWPQAVVEATVRAAWYHDALKADSVDDWLRWIAAVDQEPDGWAATKAPKLLHAHADNTIRPAIRIGERSAGFSTWQTSVSPCVITRRRSIPLLWSFWRDKVRLGSSAQWFECSTTGSNG